MKTANGPKGIVLAWKAVPEAERPCPELRSSGPIWKPRNRSTGLWAREHIGPGPLYTYDAITATAREHANTWNHFEPMDW